MSDRDWYDAHVPRNWRGIARRIEQGEKVPRVADLAFRALAKEVRQCSGVPGLSAFIDVVGHFCVGLTIPQAFAQLLGASLSQRLLRRNDGHATYGNRK